MKIILNAQALSALLEGELKDATLEVAKNAIKNVANTIANKEIEERVRAQARILAHEIACNSTWREQMSSKFRGEIEVFVRQHVDGIITGDIKAKIYEIARQEAERVLKQKEDAFIKQIEARIDTLIINRLAAALGPKS